MEFKHDIKYSKVGDEQCYNLISPSIQILAECESFKTRPIKDISKIISEYAVNGLQPIFELKIDVEQTPIKPQDFRIPDGAKCDYHIVPQKEVKTFYITPLYVGPLNKDFCNKYRLPYKDIMDDIIETDEMGIRFNPNLLYLIPDQLKPVLIGMIEIDKYSLYDIENSELMGINLGDKARYIPTFDYGPDMILSKNIHIKSDAEEIIYFEDDIPEIEIKENEISNGAYSHFLYSLN